MASRKGSTGLEWLLREADVPPPSAEESPAPGGGEPANGEAANGEPWRVTEPAKRDPAVPGLKNANSRAHPRAKVTAEIRFKKGSEQISGRCVNLSMGGFFVETTKFLPNGEVYQAQIVFPSESGNRRLAVIAEVIWATQGDPADPQAHPSGMGSKFLDVDDKDRPFLKEQIDKALAAGQSA